MYLLKINGVISMEGASLEIATSQLEAVNSCKNNKKWGLKKT